MKKLFISQPMREKTNEEIIEVRKKAIKSAEREIGEKVEVIEPIEVREQLKRIAEYMITTYGGKRNG